jgi:hypothetical protein
LKETKKSKPENPMKTTSKFRSAAEPFVLRLQLLGLLPLCSSLFVAFNLKTGLSNWYAVADFLFWRVEDVYSWPKSEMSGEVAIFGLLKP